jgi:hypothetical protein
MAQMTMTPLTGAEREALIHALRGNVQQGNPLLMNPRDTRFTEVNGDDETITDDEVVNAIKSIPTHY